MKHKVILSELARNDLAEIAETHKRLVGAQSARKITARILQALANLEQFPLIGPVLAPAELFRSEFRYLVVGKYLCFYQVVEQTVQIHHIVYGASNYSALLGQIEKENP